MKQILATHKAAPRKQVQLTIQNYLRQHVYNNREVYKENPTDPILGTWVSYSDWIKLNIAKWKFAIYNRNNIPDIEVEVGRSHMEDFLKVDRYQGYDGQELKEKIVEKFNPILKSLGWFTRRVDYYKSNGEFTVYLSPLEYRPISVPHFIYHFSQAWNKERILRKGLIPKKGHYETDFMYPPRVHLLSRFNIAEMYKLAMAVFGHGSGQGIEDLYYNGPDAAEIPLVVFKVDTSKVRPGTKFYRDPLAPDGLWTYTHIPPEALSVQYEDKIPEDAKMKILNGIPYKPLVMNVLGRLYLETADEENWWKGLTKDQQKLYIDEHPNSKYAKQVKKQDQDKKKVEKKEPTEKAPTKKAVPKPKDQKENLFNKKADTPPPAKAIKPKDGKKVVALLDKLHGMATKAKDAGEKPPNFDLCEVSIPGTNLFCGVNKGIPREKMPQLKGNPLPHSEAADLPKDDKGEVNAEDAFKEALKDKGVKMIPKKVDASRLKSTQSQLVGTKVAGMLQVLKGDPNHKAIRAPIFVSKDGYILDGHHRWAAVVGLELHEKEPVLMDTVVVDLSARELVDFTNKFANDIGIEQKGA